MKYSRLPLAVAYATTITGTADIGHPFCTRHGCLKSESISSTAFYCGGCKKYPESLEGASSVNNPFLLHAGGFSSFKTGNGQMKLAAMPAVSQKMSDSCAWSSVVSGAPFGSHTMGADVEHVFFLPLHSSGFLEQVELSFGPAITNTNFQNSVCDASWKPSDVLNNSRKGGRISHLFSKHDLSFLIIKASFKQSFGALSEGKSVFPSNYNSDMGVFNYKIKGLYPVRSVFSGLKWVVYCKGTAGVGVGHQVQSVFSYKSFQDAAAFAKSKISQWLKVNSVEKTRELRDTMVSIGTGRAISRLSQMPVEGKPDDMLTRWVSPKCATAAIRLLSALSEQARQDKI